MSTRGGRRGGGRDRQRGRQRAYRERLKRERRPGRDDVARIALHWLIVKTANLAVRTSNPARMHVVEDALLDGLVAQGFNARASEEVLDELIDKYVDGGWNFRRKLHLQEEPPASARILLDRDAD
ncbi:hypothetical protein [Pseudorhizobium flavum]|uniref:Uncharacterized protein n=1 Tax=Pseudorhizobium flavum TaxID=1335061 RepID=A0A7X0DEZ1_9HYPH|nr:hypothetical protein [Pseudorhizobium flavum]MBB6182417.1 hypothetical protein [Pseudorhizobium flavum]CAD6599324.1 hypothetical protein RFYW14_00663 [Pseudorhizobium flavum]